MIEILKEKYKAKNKIKRIGIRPGEKIHEFLINNSETPRTFEYKKLYVIVSSIEKQKKGRKPVYISKGKKLNQSAMKEFGSEDNLISKKEVKKIFKKLGLI